MLCYLLFALQRSSEIQAAYRGQVAADGEVLRQEGGTLHQTEQPTPAAGLCTFTTPQHLSSLISCNFCRLAVNVFLLERIHDDRQERGAVEEDLERRRIRSRSALSTKGRVEVLQRRLLPRGAAQSCVFTIHGRKCKGTKVFADDHRTVSTS